MLLGPWLLNLGGWTMQRWKSDSTVVWTTLFCLALSGEALAGPSPQTHDGFFLRLAPGVGGAGTKIEDGGDEINMDGSAGVLNIAIGGMVTETMALHGTLFGWSIADPETELIEGGIEIGSGELDGTLTLGGIGIGITNYFLSSNVYFSATVGAASLELDIDGLGDAESDTGIAGEVSVGKEWWVGNNWALGLAGVFGFHSIPDSDVDENFKGAHLGVLFSATFN
jgi:hypothetical protein